MFRHFYPDLARKKCGPRPGAPIRADTAAHPARAPTRAGAVSGGTWLFNGRNKREKEGYGQAEIGNCDRGMGAFRPVVIPNFQSYDVLINVANRLKWRTRKGWNFGHPLAFVSQPRPFFRRKEGRLHERN